MRLMKKLALFAALAVPVLAVPAQGAVGPSAPPPGAAASKPFVPQSSIRGVSVGMTFDQVRARLGTPGTNKATTHPILGQTRTLTYGLLTVIIDGRANTSLATSLMTTSRSDRTASGLGIGSTEAQLRAGLKGLKCQTSLGYRTCRLGVLKAGRLVTDFSISKGGKVKRISLGRVLD